MKRILPVLLIPILALSFAIPAFADVIDDPKFVNSWPLPFALVLLIVVITGLIVHTRKK